MKKLLFFFTVGLVLFGTCFNDSSGALAQKNPVYKSVYALSDANATVWDTLLNASNTKTQTLQVPPIYKKVTVQINGLKIDGTPAATCKIQRSTDGVYFYDIDSTYMKKKNLLTIANVSTVQGAIWELDNYQATHLRTTCTTTGSSQRTRIQTVILVKKDGD
ncbi:hypothetical protein [Runella sp.]|uniref:hypothetical protein n=1 Tax=Runella sp. TaxID=1960881 RepID=UPI003D0AA8AE